MVDALNKVLKGAIPGVLILITIALIIAIGSQVVDTTRDLYDTDDSTVSITNESLTVTFNILQILANTFIDNTTIVVSNATGFYDQSLFQSSAAESLVGQINITTDINDGEILNISYDFNSQNKNAAFNASTDGLAGLTTFSTFQPTFAVIIVAILVISILMIGFVVVGRRVL